jgi:hypothetical protein
LLFPLRRITLLIDSQKLLQMVLVKQLRVRTMFLSIFHMSTLVVAVVLLASNNASFRVIWQGHGHVLMLNLCLRQQQLRFLVLWLKKKIIIIMLIQLFLWLPRE